MASSIFGPRTGGSSILSALQAARSLGDPGQVYGRLYQTNPQFRSFADSVRGKTPEQAFREHGLDFDQIRRFM